MRVFIGIAVIIGWIVVAVLFSRNLVELGDKAIKEYSEDPDLCFTQYKSEEARRDNNDILFCKVDGKWLEFKKENSSE
jgi:hypothetical protein